MSHPAGTFHGTAITPTRNRAGALRRTLASLAGQSLQPARVVVVDSSDGDDSLQVCAEVATKQGEWAAARFELLARKAEIRGAAAQRTQGMRDALGDSVLLLDDDMIFEPECVARMVAALDANEQVGAVGPIMTNYCYTPPGRLWRWVYEALANRGETVAPGKCFGPAVMLLPADDPALPEVVPIDWYPTALVLYRRAALPEPLFDPFFKGYSYMEDAALSLTVGKKWKVVNARTARVFHDAQTGDHKTDRVALAEMEFVNRHYVLWTVLGDRRKRALLKLAGFELFRTFSLGRQQGRAAARDAWCGRWRGWKRIRAWRRAQLSPA